MSARYDVAVIGAGYAGLRVARDLRERGHDRVLVVEARDRVGGRTLAGPVPGTDTVVELGGTWVSPRLHGAVAADVERYGLSFTEDASAAPPRFRWRIGDEPAVDGWPLAGDELFELEHVAFRLIEDSMRIDLSRPLDEQELDDLDVSVEEYIGRLGVGPRVFDFVALWGALGAGAPPDEWSALSALTLIASGGHSAFGWYGAVSNKLVEGTSALTAAMAAELGDALRLSTVVREVTQDEDGVAVTTADGESIHARAAVVALPLNLWQGIEFSPSLAPVKAGAAVDGHPNRIRKCWALVDGVPEDTIFAGTTTTLAWLSPEAAAADGGTLMVGFSVPPAELDVSDHDAVTRAIHEHVPEARVRAVVGHDWVSDPFSLGGWPAHPPGRLSHGATALEAPEGRVVFAGADIARRWTGWLEGAAESADRAVAAVGELLDRERSDSTTTTTGGTA